MADDRHRELGAVLSYLVGRQLRTSEMVSALGLSRSAYYLQRDEGRLVTADNLLKMAAAFDLNPIDLLVRYGLVSDDDVASYVEDLGTATGRAAEARGRRLKPRLDAPPI